MVLTSSHIRVHFIAAVLEQVFFFKTIRLRIHLKLRQIINTRKINKFKPLSVVYIFEFVFFHLFISVIVMTFSSHHFCTQQLRNKNISIIYFNLFLLWHYIGDSSATMKKRTDAIQLLIQIVAATIQ